MLKVVHAYHLVAKTYSYNTPLIFKLLMFLFYPQLISITQDRFFKIIILHIISFLTKLELLFSTIQCKTHAAH